MYGMTHVKIVKLILPFSIPCFFCYFFTLAIVERQYGYGHIHKGEYIMHLCTRDLHYLVPTFDRLYSFVHNDQDCFEWPPVFRDVYFKKYRRINAGQFFL